MVVLVEIEDVLFHVTVYYDKGVGGEGPDDSRFEVEKVEYEFVDFTNLLADSVIEEIKEKAWEQIDG